MRGLLRIATHETRRYARVLDRRVVIAAIVVGLIIGVAWPIVQDRGVQPEQGIYTVALDPSSPLAPAVGQDGSFSIVTPRADGSLPTGTDLVIEGETVVYDPTSDKSQAAALRLERTVKDWLDRQLTLEADQDAAFPVRVHMLYETRSLSGASATGAGPPAAEPPETEAPNASEEDPEPGPAPNGTGPGNATAGTEATGLAPSEVSPPFPMQSLLLTFAYLIPLTFIGELYGGSVFAERVKSRGVLLLSTPMGPAEILAGKSLPYVAGTLVLAGAISAFIGAGFVGFLAALPIVAFALAAALLIGILAPSQRALTFLLVSTNVLLSTFLFLPAIFTEVPPISFMSPVGVIAAAIRGDAVGIGQLLYATVPLWLVTALLVLLSVSLYREETLFSPGSTTSKLVDGIARLVTSRRRLLLAGILVVPLALVLELFVLVFAVTLDLATAFVVFLIGAAFVEELVKALPTYASNTRRGDGARTSVRASIVAGSLVGTGFFLGEKGALALALVGFRILPRGPEALATFGVASSALLVLAPLALHVVTASISSLASRNSRGWALAGLVAAGLLHASYNAGIIILLGGGGL